MRVILTPVGSHGDVHPFVALGIGLKARGHSVTLVAAEPFRPLAELHGFDYAQTMPTDEYERLTRHPDLWHPKRSMHALFDPEVAAKWLPHGFEMIRERYVRGETVVAAGALALAARVANEVLGIPLATVHLAPVGLFSAANPPVYPALRFRSWWPKWFRRAVFRAGEKLIVDPLVGKLLHPFRDSHGLPRARRLFTDWLNSPLRMLGFFPDWFAHAPDWPARFRHVGFLRYDQADAHPVPTEVRDFLNAGEPPVVFSFGSAMRTGRAHFEAAVTVCERLGVRGLLLAKGRDQIPPNLPKSVLHAEYAPFSEVFPLAKAVVHHGGIGTSAQALAAGVPQLVMPMAFDQPDNGERLRKLGVARVVPAARFTPSRASAALAELLNAPTVPAACATLRQRLTATDPVADACAAIEELRGKDTPAR